MILAKYGWNLILFCVWSIRRLLAKLKKDLDMINPLLALTLFATVWTSCERQNRSVNVTPNQNNRESIDPKKTTPEGEEESDETGNLVIAFKDAGASAKVLRLQWSYQDKTGSSLVSFDSGMGDATIESLPVGTGTIELTGTLDGKSIKKISESVTIRNLTPTVLNLSLSRGDGSSGGTSSGGSGGSSSGGSGGSSSGGSGGSSSGGSGGSSSGGSSGSSSGGGSESDIIIIPEIEPSDTKPDIKPDIKPDVKPDFKPDIKPDPTPDSGDEKWDGKSIKSNDFWKIDLIAPS
jgi:hypothetical protein